MGFFGLRKPSGDAKMMNDFDKLVTESAKASWDSLPFSDGAFKR
ncbi:MAG: hypothetical protein R2865_09405 [Deinococcales bacterium]